jgi:hypothetical protein
MSPRRADLQTIVRSWLAGGEGRSVHKRNEFVGQVPSFLSTLSSLSLVPEARLITLNPEHPTQGIQSGLKPSKFSPHPGLRSYGHLPFPDVLLN